MDEHVEERIKREDIGCRAMSQIDDDDAMMFGS